MATGSSTVQPVKRGKLSEMSSDTDRITKLPDPVLHHILSFLSTKEAARTSVLSRLWQHLWTWVPNLDINGLEIIHVKGTGFDQIVFKILLSRRAFCIRKFRLVYRSECSLISFRTILCAAVERNVEELDLCVEGSQKNKLFELPPSLFRCKSLVALKLIGENIMLTTEYSVHFPRLKVLHLGGVKYKDEDTFHSLFTGCPALEYLFVCFCESIPSNTVHYKISSLTLRHLILRCLDDYPTKVTVSAPVLEHFTIHHNFSPCVFDFENVSNFVHAKVIIDDPIYETLEPADWKTMMAMLEALCNVQFLELHFIISKALNQHIALDDVPRFDNLVVLCLSGFPSFLLLFLNMINNCPQLKHLSVSPCMHDGTPKEAKYWISPQHVPSCLSFHLTAIVYGGFQGSEDEMEFTRYVLENAKVLRSMTIRYDNKTDLKRAFGPFQKIFGFEKLSKRCQLIFEEV